MNPLLLIRELASDVLVERLGWVLVHSLWQFTLIAFVAAIVVRLLGRRRAAARYAVLVGAMAVLVASPVATWCLQPERVAIAEVAPAVAEGPIATGAAPATPRLNALEGDPADAALAVDLPAEELPARPEWRGVPDVAATEPAPLSLAESVERTLRPWLAWIVVEWSLGVVLCSLRPLLGWHALWRLRRVGVSPVGEEISAALRRVVGQLGLRQVVQVLQSTLVQTPVLVGYFRPAILLPVGLATGLPIAQLEAILAHELAHVRRHDFVVNLLQTLVETLCFYHPAVWWLSRQIRVERELCCDDLVVGLLGNRVEYGRALLAVEELRGTSSVLALGMADGVLLSRVRRLFGARSDLSAVRPGERWVVLALAALGLLVTLLGVRTGLNVGRDSDVEPAQFSVTLPNGTVVELLGVATGEKDSPWWRPDGTRMNQPPLTGLPISTGFEPAKNCRSFAVRVRGAGSDDSWMVADGAKQFHSVGRGDPGGVVERVMTTDALPQQDLGTLRVGVERGEFGPPQPVSSAGRKIEVTLPEELRPWYDAVPLPRVEEVDGKVRLVFPPPDFSQHRHFVEWSVVDVDGNRSLTFDLPLSRVDRFEYRLQPRKHWVTFENVSLQPGRTSEVKVSTEPPPRPGAFVAKLPGDIAVELVGVGFHPSKDKPWWKPDGRPLEPRPMLEGGFSVMSGSPQQAQCREFLIHIRGLPREHAVTTDYGPVSAATGSSYSNGLWVGEHGAGPFKSDTTSVRVGLTTEPYGPTVEIDITGTRQPAELPADLQPFYDRIVPLRVEEVDGQTELILDGKASNNLFKEAAWELHAVDVDGEKHRRSSESVTRSGERHFTFKLPRNRIARFEYRLRPYRHWATFENVSLEPGRTTEVKVSTESQPAPRPGRYSATLPDGVKVSFVGITKNTAPAKEGWRPDGLPLGDVPEWPAGLVLYGGSTTGRTRPAGVPIDADASDFLFEFQGLQSRPSLSFALPASAAAYSHDPVDDPHRLRVSGRLRDESKTPGAKFDPPTDEVRVGLTTEPWGKWVQVSPTGEVLNPLQPDDLYWASYAQVRLQRVGPSEKDPQRLALVLSQPVRRDRLYAFQIRGIDTDGGEHWVTNWISQGSVDNGPVETEWGLGTPLPAGKQLARFEYRLRPYRHWVTFKGVSLEAGKESDVKVSVETVQATADFPRPRPEDVRGLDLSRAAVRHYSEATRLSPEQQTPELLVPGSDPAEPWRRPKNVFLMPLAENIWLKYPAGSGHFYINHRPDGTWQHERMYGPIEGDPFELLNLEELFREQLKPGATGGDPRYRLTLMFRTGEPELIRRAWRLIEPELIVETTGPDAGDPVAGSAVRYTEQDPRRFERIESLGRVREALRDEAEAFRRPELTDVAARMREIVAAAEAAIDATNDAVADSAYESVTYLQPGLKAKIPEALWGPPLDGLRLGLVPSDGIDWSKWQQLPTDKPLPTHITALSGDELQYLVVVENVSDREIKLSGYVVGQEMARGLEMLDQHGRPVDIENLHASTLHIRSYWRLKPGERQLLTMPAVNLTSAPADPAKRRLGYSVKAVPGYHTLRCTIRFGNLDNERHRYVPGKSEWIGELSTGAQKITVAERVLDAGEDPAADQSVSLVDAVRDFNAENKQRGRGQEPPPLTEEEVVAAIQRSDWKRDTKDVTEREFAAFKAVAKTRRLPEGAKLEVLTGVQSDAFTTSRLWSIRLIMPALERAGTVGFSIRHTVLGEEKIDPEQVAWGKPDADGLSLGLFLSPRKAQYQIGERVQLRLFVRNEGRKAIDDLTFMNITWPVIEDFTVTDQTGARVAVRNGHEEWSGPQWIAGAIRSRLEAGDAYALRVPFEIGIGGEVDKPVGRILDAKPGQTLRLRVRAANGSERIRAADEPKPESGEVTLTVQTQTAAVDDAKNPSNRPAALPRATLTGRFVYDGEAPPRKDLWPQFAEIDATQRQPPGPDGRFSGVEATYREFLKQNIRPSTLDSSLLVDKSGGVANVVIWVTSKELPWTPPADLAQRPVTIRLKDGHFSPRMTVAMVGQPVVVENLDPVPFGIHTMFRKNSDFNPLLPSGTDVEPFHWTGVAAEPFPAHYRCDQGPWTDGWLFVAANPYVAVSRADGTFTLPDLPPGEWEFRVWHERRGYLQHWPKGVFRRVIEPGRNDLGEIRLKPELLAER